MSLPYRTMPDLLDDLLETHARSVTIVATVTEACGHISVTFFNTPSADDLEPIRRLSETSVKILQDPEDCDSRIDFSLDTAPFTTLQLADALISTYQAKDFLVVSKFKGDIQPPTKEPHSYDVIETRGPLHAEVVGSFRSLKLVEEAITHHLLTKGAPPRVLSGHSNFVRLEVRAVREGWGPRHIVDLYEWQLTDCPTTGEKKWVEN